MIGHLGKGGWEQVNTDMFHECTLGSKKEKANQWTDFTLYVICLRAKLLVVFIRVSPFDGHVLIFFLKPLDRLLACYALVFYMLLGTFDFLSRVGQLFRHVLYIRIVNVMSME